VSSPATPPPINGDLQSLESAGRDELLDIYQHYRSVSNELLRRAIIEHNRIDLLATEILGYEVQPFHLKMLQFQFEHPQSLQLAYRGAGKTSLGTVAKAIHYLLKNPNLRILLASKDIGNDKTFLREIKAHLEGNERLIEVFGEQYDPRKVTKWDETEIEILPRTSTAKEPSICCASPDSGLTSRHVDVILTDDLVVEENSRTKAARDRVKTWYYQTLLPCLEPPDDIEHRGEHHRLGTRYHYDELYGHLIENELKEHHQVIPGLDDEGRSPWPEKHAPEWFEENKRIMGVILFNAQYLCDTQAMKGQVFQLSLIHISEPTRPY